MTSKNKAKCIKQLAGASYPLEAKLFIKLNKTIVRHNCEICSEGGAGGKVIGSLWEGADFIASWHLAFQFYIVAVGKEPTNTSLQIPTGQSDGPTQAGSTIFRNHCFCKICRQESRSECMNTKTYNIHAIRINSLASS